MTLLLATALAILAAGVVLAIVRPGELGREEPGLAPPTDPAPVAPPPGQAPPPDRPPPGPVPPTTLAAANGEVDGPASAPRSGLGTEGAGKVPGSGRIADTGGSSLVGLGLLLMAAGLVLGRAALAAP